MSNAIYTFLNEELWSKRLPLWNTDENLLSKRHCCYVVCHPNRKTLSLGKGMVEAAATETTCELLRKLQSGLRTCTAPMALSVIQLATTTGLSRFYILRIVAIVGSNVFVCISQWRTVFQVVIAKHLCLPTKFYGSISVPVVNVVALPPPLSPMFGRLRHHFRSKSPRNG